MWQSDALAPESFVGVNAPAHIAALEALYTDVNPDKLAQIPLMWDKFGAGIWQALVPKYPHVRCVCPARSSSRRLGVVFWYSVGGCIPPSPTLAAPECVASTSYCLCFGSWCVGGGHFGAGYRCDALCAFSEGT